MNSISLDGIWKLRGFDGQHGRPEEMLKEDFNELQCIDAVVPGEVHLDLQRAGLMDDYNIGLNVLKARWVEEQVWVYRRSFNVPKEALSAKKAWLVFEGLDINANIYLNAEAVGSHNNCFIPCRIDVTGKLVEGKNDIVIEIESGLYDSAEKPGIPYTPRLSDYLTKRHWERKPQYSYSWDWAPRLVNVGIWRPVRLEWSDAPRLDAVTIFPELADDHSTAEIKIRAFVDNPDSTTAKAIVKACALETGESAEVETELPPGISRQDLSIAIANPKLWWPRPHGDQPLYTIQTEVIVDGKTVDKSLKRAGIRSIKINMDPHPEAGEYFTLEINGKKIFAKGGNWVPPDSIYSRPDAEHYRTLVKLAVEANFNTLRVWGGGLYANHDFLDACDEMGVIVWHDFIFACAKYPADDPDFLRNVRKEVTFITRDLSAHPSLVVWCGNNELEWATWDWGYDNGKCFPDYVLYHHEIPRIVKNEDPSRPYWPSSPYSTDHRPPTDPTTGDQHPWQVSLLGEGPNFWAYRTNVSRFPNEGGVLGASSPATLKQFLPENQRHLFSPSWELHDNDCNYWVESGLTYATVKFWLGLDPLKMSFEDYCLYSALLQAEGLKEYSDNFRRRMFSSSCAIFWMYNDSWPATHGWTIVDYYLRRKLAYHPVRRAYSPIYVIPAIEGETVKVFAINETTEPWAGEVRFGIFGLQGGLRGEKAEQVVLEPNTNNEIGEISLDEWKAFGLEKSGVYALLTQNGEIIAQNRIFCEKFKDLQFAKPDIKVERNGGFAVFTSPVFVWGAVIDPDGEKPVPDDVFDILPGIPYSIPWPDCQPLPEIAWIGNLQK